MGKSVQENIRAVASRFHIMAPCLLLVAAIFAKNHDPVGLGACAIVGAVFLGMKVLEVIWRKRSVAGA